MSEELIGVKIAFGVKFLSEIGVKFYLELIPAELEVVRPSPKPLQIPIHIADVHVMASGETPPLHLASSAAPSFLGLHKPSAAPPHHTIDYQSILS